MEIMERLGKRYNAHAHIEVKLNYRKDSADCNLRLFQGGTCTQGTMLRRSTRQGTCLIHNAY